MTLATEVWYRPSMKRTASMLCLAVLAVFVLYESLLANYRHDSVAHAQMVVVFPFILNEVSTLRTSISEHWVTDPSLTIIPACSGDYAGQMDLVFAYNQNHTDPEHAEELVEFLELARSMMGHCFNKIDISSFYLTEEEDVHPARVTFQIFRMIIDTEKYFDADAGYKYMQVMDADMYAVSANWLDMVYKEILVDESFWMKGAYSQSTDWDEYAANQAWINDNMNFWGYFINGAALFNLEDPEFKGFVLQTMNNFPPKVNGASYDITLTKQRMINSCLYPDTIAKYVILPTNPVDCLRFRQNIDQKFQHSDYVQMRDTFISISSTNVDDILASAITALIHGAPPSISTSLKQLPKKVPKTVRTIVDPKDSLILSELERLGSIMPMKVFSLKQGQWNNDTQVGFAFWHVPKSAGTEMHAVMRNFFQFRFTKLSSMEHYRLDVALEPEEVCKPGVTDCTTLTVGPRTVQYRAVIGTYEWMMAQHMNRYGFKNYLLVMNFREPIACRKSLYTYRLKPPPWEIDQRSTMNMTMTEFVSNFSASDNFVCRNMAAWDVNTPATGLVTEETLSKAVNNLERVFVLLTEDLAESVLLLHSFLGTRQCHSESLLRRHDNAQKTGKKPKYVFTEEDDKILAEANFCDLPLYDKALDRYALQVENIKRVATSEEHCDY